MENIVEKAVDILAKNVTKEKNILKVVEECAELQDKAKPCTTGQ